MEKAQDKSKNKWWIWILFGLFLLLGGYATWMIHLDKPRNSTILYTAAFLCLIFFLLDKFESFEVFGIFGIKAKLRKIDEKIHEADELLKLLKGISLPLARNMVYVTSQMGRWGSTIPRRERSEFMSALEQALKDMDIPTDKIEEMKKYWHRNNFLDLAEEIRYVVRKAYSDEIHRIEITRDKELNDKLALAKKENDDFSALLEGSLWNLHNDLKIFIENSQAFSDDIKQKWLQDFHEDLLDIEYYAMHKDFRRKEHFFAKDDDRIID